MFSPVRGRCAGYSTFGQQKFSGVAASPSTAIPRAKHEDKLPVVSPIAQFPAGQRSSFGKQALSTRSGSSRALMGRRGSVNPVPRQWTDVGPGAYMPPSTYVFAVCSGLRPPGALACPG